ncbi:MAG: preprotein translocase subunit YajC [Candidatus Mycalebacterium zealandia]|nr:MAG: preprotein translocase subunit YajC [Candidatus Mycalebacterium zealandia]
MLTGVLPFVLLFVIFYFLIIRPQQKRSRVRDEMLKSLKRGDEVITNGGIYATITDRDGEIITLEIAKGVTVKATLSAAASKTEQEAGN